MKQREHEYSLKKTNVEIKSNVKQDNKPSAENKSRVKV